MLLSFGLMLLLSNGLTIRPDTSILYSRIGLIIIFYCICATLMSFHITYLQQGIGLFGGLFNATCITHSFQLFIFIITGLILLMTAFFPRKRFVEKSTINTSMFTEVKQYVSIINKVAEQFTIIEYALIIIFVIIGAVLLLISADLGSIYLCLELQSYSLYIISSMHRNSESSTGSALTYFLLGGLSSCFVLLGIALIYANSGITNLDGMYAITSDSELYNTFSTWYMHNYLFFSLLLISIGFLFKIAAAPFHWWSPDVYDGVPTIVTTFIAILGKIALLILFLFLVHYTTTLLYSTIQSFSWMTSLTISCFFSLIIGTLLGLSQTRIKRLLAYSTISHIGFMLLALISYTIDSEKAFIFYLIQYILTNFMAFMVIIAIGISLYLYYSNIEKNNSLSEKSNSPIQLISQLKGYFSINPILALCLVVALFSFIGLPPLAGFFGKQMVLTFALDNHKIVLVVIAILTSVIGAVYYLNIISTIYSDDSDYKKLYGLYSIFSLSNAYSITLSILVLIILVFVLIPKEILNLSELLVLNGFSDTMEFKGVKSTEFTSKIESSFNEMIYTDESYQYDISFNKTTEGSIMDKINKKWIETLINVSTHFSFFLDRLNYTWFTRLVVYFSHIHFI